MHDFLTVLDEWLVQARAGHMAALCVVVQTRGSAPQSPGAMMLVRQDFSTVGTLGGGCVEAEVRRRAFEVVQQDRTGLLAFTLDHDYGWDDGLICGGRMEIAVFPASDAALIAAAEAALRAARQRCVAELPLRVERDGAWVEYRLRRETPPTALIAGGGHVGRAVASLAASVDFDVVVVDDRPDLRPEPPLGPHVRWIVADIGRTLRDFPLNANTYVVIVTRGHQHDEEALDAVIRRHDGYIGLIGSRRKAQLIFRDLLAAGVPPAALERVHTPIGLPIGAVTVPEIAMSIVAELIQEFRKCAKPTIIGPYQISPRADCCDGYPTIVKDPVQS